MLVRIMVSRLAIIASIAASLMMPATTQAQAYPNKPVRMLTQFAPGSSGDTLVRIFSAPFAELMGQPVLIENIAGAGGLLAAQQVARAAPDGYNLMAGTSSTQVIRRFMAKTMPFDPEKDFTPISQLIQSLTTIVISPSLQVDNLKDLVEYAKANPGKIAYGTSGVGSEHHLSGEQIGQLTGAKMVHVPYKASMQALIDASAGRLPMAFAIYSVAVPQVKAGKVKYLAVVREKRSPRLPDVPAIPEVVPGFEPPPSWVGILGPANLPAAVLKRISSDTIRTLNQADTRQKLEAQGLEIVGSSPEEFAALIRRQTELVARIVKGAGIQPGD